MNYTTVTAALPGKPIPRIEKRTQDSKIFLVDCNALLTPNELITGEIVADSPPGVTITEARSRQGKYIQFRLSGGPPVAPFAEYNLKFLVATTMNNAYTVPVLAKVFSE